ncbi:nucleotidyltransferase family protein [Candidatus Aerophobetes bacterium]|nr:nucleotidyltransferase family protein [Candidatus Aerophobetes bacterium]
MISGIVLAAGEGKRMGKAKLLLPLGNKPLIEWMLKAVKLSSLNKFFLVVRPGDSEIIKLGRKWGAEIVLNPDFQSGMSSSIKKALQHFPAERVKGFLIFLGDQPLINSIIINQIISAFSPGKGEMVVPFYKGRRGNPVLFDICWRDELMAVTGDVGGRVLIKAHPKKVKVVKISNEAVLFDIDKEEDYLKAQTYFNPDTQTKHFNSLPNLGLTF